MITAFIYAGLALAVAAFGVNLYFAITRGLNGAVHPFYPILQYTLMGIVSVALFVILISLILSSYYAVDGKTLKTSFGIIKSKYDLEKVESIILDRETNKLSIHFDDGAFIVIVVKPEWYDDFVEAVLRANPKIDYAVKSKENTPDDDQKK